MSAESAVRALLLAAPAVAALVGDRIEPAPLSQGSEMPAVSYQRIGTVRTESYEGPSGLAAVRIQYDCWAETFDDARSLFEAVRVALNGKRSVPHGIQKMQLVDGSDRDLPEPEVQLHRVTCDYRVWHTEAAA